LAGPFLVVSQEDRDVPSALDRVLSQISQVANAAAEDYDGTSEWFFLESDDYYDDELYWTLNRKWAQIVGPNMRQFALIYCGAEPESGTWLHYLSTKDLQNEYAPGSHRLESW
jgi:hypothetical protein